MEKTYNKIIEEFFEFDEAIVTISNGWSHKLCGIKETIYTHAGTPIGTSYFSYDEIYNNINSFVNKTSYVGFRYDPLHIQDKLLFLVGNVLYDFTNDPFIPFLDDTYSKVNNTSLCLLDDIDQWVNKLKNNPQYFIDNMIIIP